MAWYTTGTIAVSGTTVTGTSTNFLDNTQSIGPGQALLIPGSGTVKMYEIASVQSATKLTLKTSAGTVAAGQAYAILSFYTDSVPDFARRLAAQLSYYQSQMDGWQQIMTGTGSITMTAPDGTTVTISSFSKLTSDVANTLKLPTANSSGDVGSLITPGVYSIPSSMTGAPISSNGVLMVTAIASGNSVVQDFTCTSTSATNYGRVFRRVGTIASGVTTWTDWASQNLWHIEASSIDLNTYIRPGTYAGGSFVNGPSAMGTAVGFMIVLGNVPGLNITQQITYVASGRTWTRTSSAGTWTAWVESLTTNSFGTAAGTVAQGNDARLNTVNGKSGGTVSTGLAVSAKDTSAQAFIADVLSQEGTSGNYTNRMLYGYGTSTTYDVAIQYRLLTGQYHYTRVVQNGIETFTARSNGACYAVSFNPTSDSNLKFNKSFIDSALLKSMSLRGMTYHINGDRKAGVIAQDAQSVLPESVTRNTEPVVLEDGTVLNETLSLDYSAIAGLHAEALKELIPLMLEMLTEPESAKTKLSALIAAVNKSNDDANETDMKMEWALLNPPVTPVEEQPADEGQETTDESVS